MSKEKKQGYVIDLEAFKKGYKKETGEDLTKYQIAKLLGITYQSVDNWKAKPNQTLSHLKKLSELSKLTFTQLIKKL